MKLSTRGKLTLFFTTLFSVMLILALGILLHRVHKNLMKDFYSEMIHDGRFLAEIFKEELKLNELKEFEDEITEFGVEVLVLDPDNKVSVQSKGWDGIGLTISAETLTAIKEKPIFKDVSTSKRALLLFSRPLHIPSIGTYSLHIVRSYDSLNKIIKTILNRILLIFPFMVILSAIAGYMFSSRTLEAETQAFDQLKKFTADASHELRHPLTALRGNIEVALRKDRSIAEYKTILAEALDEAENLSQLTQDLLLMAQADAKKMNLNIQSVDIEPFFREVFSQAEGLRNDTHAKMLIAPTPKGTVRFDPDRVKQMIFNLIDNALKYNRPNGEVRVSAELGNQSLVITVADTGIGIPQEETGKVFDRFYRVDKARSREMGGSGLGLSIVKWIVDAHKGRITLESQEGKGTTIKVEFKNDLA